MTSRTETLTSSLVIEPIDDLVMNIGEKDLSAEGLIPVIERDPILQGLVRIAQAVRAAAGRNTQQQIYLKR